MEEREELLEETARIMRGCGGGERQGTKGSDGGGVRR